jgi:hypothetical protein
MRRLSRTSKAILQGTPDLLSTPSAQSVSLPRRSWLIPTVRA